MSHFVIAVIPVFHAPPALAARVTALREQVDAVVLVDDGTHSTAALGLELPSLHIVEIAENSGIGNALNEGVQRARELGATHVLTLDQDSSAPAGYVEGALRILAASAASGVEVAAVVPEFVGGQRVLLRDGFAFDPIQAGQLIPISVLDEVGPYRSDLFIDAVDSEFSIRAEEHGLRFVVAAGAQIAHELGELVPLTVFGRHLVIAGKPRHVLYHAPFRTYYMVRNSTILVRVFGRRRRRWMLFRTRKMAEMVVGCVVLSPDRGAQWRAAVAGLSDGLRGVTGRVSEERLRAIRGSRRRR
ncbi:glycosyltransferase [uncultured Microbacterium sp.]|uniref:glycosyltransferase n=1 Tax=uncultured Microbacterium sp. TaxID=191216 RepID=UPI0026006351|nr:glycosyltransferase [uncultured Microbacterium sp.]